MWTVAMRGGSPTTPSRSCCNVPTPTYSARRRRWRALTRSSPVSNVPSRRRPGEDSGPSLPRDVLEAADRKRRPSLVAGAHPAPGVATEVLGEGDEVTPVRIVAQARVLPVARATSAGAAHEQAGEPVRELARNLGEVHATTGTRRPLDLERVAVEGMGPLERREEEVVHGEPSRSPPVRVATEERRLRLGGRVVHLVLPAVDDEHERVVAMHTRQRPDA